MFCPAPPLQVCAYNRTVSKVHDFLQNEAKGTKVVGAETLEGMVSKLKKPRRIVLLVKAGQAVDDFIDKLVRWSRKGGGGPEGAQSGVSFGVLLPNDCLCAHRSVFLFQVPLLSPGDIIIDGGNSEYRDTTVSSGLYTSQHGNACISIEWVDVLAVRFGVALCRNLAVCECIRFECLCPSQLRP